jgi:hypothetical protein
MRRLALLLLGTAALSLGAFPVSRRSRAQDDDRARPDSLEKKQKAIADAYKQLEEALSQSWSSFSRVEPEKASRIKRALDASKQAFSEGDGRNTRSIADRMHDVLDLLQKKDSKGALVGENEVVEQLERVLELLEADERKSADRLDPKRIEALLEEIKELIRDQKDHRSQVDRAKDLEAIARALSEAQKKLDEVYQAQKQLADKTGDAKPGELADLAKSQREIDAQASEIAKLLDAVQGLKAAGEPSPGAGDAKPSAGESKPSAGDAKPSPGEPKPSSGESKPSSGDAKPSPDEAKPSPSESKPAPSESKPAPSESKPSDDGSSGSSDGAAGSASKAVASAKGAMNEAAKKLDSPDKDAALERERRALEELEKAKAALEKKRQQVERLAQLDRLKAEEERLQKKTDDLAKKMGEQPADPKQQDPKGGQGGQGQKGGNQKGGNQKGGSSKSQGPVPGKRHVERAEDEQKRAQDDLENRYVKDASEKEDEAVQQLEQAQEAMREALIQARKREQEELLKTLGIQFQEMLAKQRELTKRTEALDKERLGSLPADAPTRPELNRAQRIECAGISKGEGELRDQADQANELVKEEGSATILPIVVEEVKQDLSRLAELTDKRDTGRFVVSLQHDVERSLEELIEVIKKEIEERKGGGGGGGGGGSGSQEDPLLPASAELKMIRAQQMRVNGKTKEFDVGRGQPDSELTPDQREACRHISEKQARVAEFTRRLHLKLNKQEQ